MPRHTDATAMDEQGEEREPVQRAIEPRRLPAYRWAPPDPPVRTARCTVKSVDPVPRSPDECHVSRISTSAAGKNTRRKSLVVDDRAAADPLAVLRAAPPLPPTRDDETALGRAADAARRECAAGDRERIAAVDLVGVRFGEVRRHRRGRRRDHRAPRRRRIVSCQLVDHLHEGHGIELRAAVLLGQAELEEASLGEHRTTSRGKRLSDSASSEKERRTGPSERASSRRVTRQPDRGAGPAPARR